MAPEDPQAYVEQYAIDRIACQCSTGFDHAGYWVRGVPGGFDGADESIADTALVFDDQNGCHD